MADIAGKNILEHLSEYVFRSSMALISLIFLAGRCGHQQYREGAYRAHELVQGDGQYHCDLGLVMRFRVRAEIIMHLSGCSHISLRDRGARIMSAKVATKVKQYWGGRINARRPVR